ncbi:hypothetical protein POVWA1_004590 [Plasmodium ovale wallikeri]|uniref:PIR Superfamily Protein n=1 Tax=Plasmodium ovale wallikeri TaxID=864142 RepID=A0A1A8YHB4_PLAOA|nr:hypothetical protein POVWA1_004590 [Plasmodium ovale wallikeri]
MFKEKRNNKCCKEFIEFHEIYKLDKFFWKNSTYSTGYTYSGDNIDECPLVFESIQNPILIKYKEERNMLHLSDQPIDSLKSSIISGSSTVDAIVGICTFLTIYIRLEGISFYNINTYVNLLIIFY